MNHYIADATISLPLVNDGTCFVRIWERDEDEEQTVWITVTGPVANSRAIRDKANFIASLLNSHGS